MPKKIVIAVGGSGGHLLPAQVLASELKGSVCFAGSGLAKNPFFDKEGYPFKDISSSGSLLKGSLKLMKGLYQALSFFKEFKPDIVVGVGSWHSVPVIMAAVLKRIPLVLYSADAVPSKVIRLFSPFAEWTGLSFVEALRYIKGPSRFVAWPLRATVASKPSRESAFAYYGLDPTKKTVLVFGGSQGAKSLNALVKEALSTLPVQVIHFCGPHENEKELQAFYGSRAVVKVYEPNMGFAWSAADLVICRSGASTLAEQFHYGVPAIYVPYPHASDDHQRINALYAKAIGGGEIKEERQMNGEDLASTINTLLNNVEHYKNAIEQQRQYWPRLNLAEEVMK